MMGVNANTVRALAADGVIEHERLPNYRREYELLDTDVEKLAERYRADRNWRWKKPFSETVRLIDAGYSDEVIAERVGIKVRSVARARSRRMG